MRIIVAIAIVAVVCAAIAPFFLGCYEGDPGYGDTNYPSAPPFERVRDASADR